MTIDEVNQHYAIVSVGNRMVVMQTATDGSIVELWDYEHFKKRFIKERVKVRTAAGKEKMMQLADFWLGHPRGRAYDKLVYSMPGSHTPAGERDYNGWQGFSVKPKPGDWSLNRAHLHDIICRGDEEAFTWVMNWIAALVQLPGRHAWVALVLMGGQGIGKGHLANNMIGRLFGSQQYIHILGSGQLTADHNEHLSGKVYIYADESTWGGDPRAAAKIKGLVTEDSIPIHRKFLKMVDEPSMLHIAIASNNEWPIPIESGDRRFTILAVSEEKKQDQSYFGQLLLELANGGRAALLADLLSYKVDDNMLRTPYNTAAKAQVAVQSMKAIEHWWFEILERGTIFDDLWPTQILKRDLHSNYLAFLDRHHKQSKERRSTETEMGKFLKRVAPLTQQMTVNGTRERWVTVSPLEFCRAEWLKTAGWKSNYAWDDDAAELSDTWEPPSPATDVDEM